MDDDDAFDGRRIAMGLGSAQSGRGKLLPETESLTQGKVSK